jgi:hypothetical protein
MRLVVQKEMQLAEARKAAAEVEQNGLDSEMLLTQLQDTEVCTTIQCYVQGVHDRSTS